MELMTELIPAFSGIFLPIILGLICRNGNYIDKRNRPVIQQFSVRAAVPFMVFESLRTLDIQTARQFIPMALGHFLFTGAVWALSWLAIELLAKRSRWIGAHKAELIIMALCGNIGNICWKLQELLAGAKGLQRGIFYTTFFFPSLITFSLLTVLTLKLHKQQELDRKNILYNVIPVMTFIVIGLVVGIFGIGLPEWLTTFTGHFGDMAVPIVLFCMGLSISVSESFRDSIAAIPYLLIRQALWIGVTLIMLQLPFYDHVSRQVLIINALAPLAINPLIIGDMFGLDTDFMAGTTTISTLYFLILLPLLFLFWPF